MTTDHRFSDYREHVSIMMSAVRPGAEVILEIFAIAYADRVAR